MSITAQQLVDSAGRLIGVVASGESLTAQESADALITFNQLLESLSLERLTVYATVPATYNLSAGQQAYSIGNYPAGVTSDFNGPRPAEIEQANLLISSGGSTLRRQVEVVTDLGLWSRVVSSLGVRGRPRRLLVTGTYPQATITFDYAPDAAYIIELFVRQQLTSIASLAQSITFPLGYERMLRYALAIELAAEYGKQIPASVADRAAQAKMQVQSNNADTQAPLMRCDSAFLGGRGRYFDYRTGGY